MIRIFMTDGSHIDIERVAHEFIEDHLVIITEEEVHWFPIGSYTRFFIDE